MRVINLFHLIARLLVGPVVPVRVVHLLYLPGEVVEHEYVLVDEELVVAEAELGRRSPLPHHLHELLQLVPLVPHSLGEVLPHVDATPLQELGFPHDLFFILSEYS